MALLQGPVYEAYRTELIKRYKHLLRSLGKTISKEKIKLVRDAFDMAARAHEGTVRKSGEPYIFHPLAVAEIAVSELGLGVTSVVCALLHDVVEDTDITLEDIEHRFGKDVANIIDGLTKISTVFETVDKDHSIQAENFKKMLLTLGDDLKVILIKLCDRLHNMRTLGSVSENTKLFNPSHSKMYQPNDMFVYDHEQILIQNIKLVKMICGDPSDNIAGIKNLGVRRLITMVPEIKTEEISIDFILNRFNNLFEEDNDNRLVKNLLTGVTKYGVLGEEFFDVNSRIVSLENPFLTEDARDSINSLINDLIDPEGRSYKNTMKMMMEDGIFLLLPKSDDAWINFLNPFLRLTRKEKNKKLIKIKDNE